MRISSKLAATIAVAAVASASTFVSNTASAAYLTYTGSVTFSNPTTTGPGPASVSTVGSDAFFQTPDVGSDGFYNSIEFVHKNSTAANNASGAGTTIILANDFVTPYEETVVENVGFDFAITLNFSEFADVAKTIQTGTGTATVNGHVTSMLGNFGASTSATFALPSQTFTTTSASQYKLSNFTFVPGDADNAGGISAKLQAVPEPATLGVTAVAAIGLLGRRRPRAM